MIINTVLNLFFPKVCYGCHAVLSDNEQDICTVCRDELPVTNYHFTKSSVIHEIFYGRLQLQSATALFKFHKKGIVQQLLHNLKYRGHEIIGTILGAWLGSELSGLADYKCIDIVIPVPLHKSKLKQRGYNQMAAFGTEIAKALSAEYIDNVLVKTSATKTQVFKSRNSRWNSIRHTFSINNANLIHNKHILIVDDIITTGATIESCVNVLNTNAQNLKISVATIALA